MKPCNGHFIATESVTENLYLSCTLTDAWKLFIQLHEKYPNVFICLHCNTIFDAKAKMMSHFKEADHNLYLVINMQAIYCCKCKKAFKVNSFLVDYIARSIPINFYIPLQNGFRNLGNSCYASSILVALSHLSSLRLACAHSSVPTCRAVAACIFCSRNFNYLMHALLPAMDPRVQADAAEFLLLVLDNMTNDPLVRRIFSGKIISHCVSKDEYTKTPENFTIFNVPLDEKGWEGTASHPNMARSYGAQNIWGPPCPSSFFSKPLSLEKCVTSVFRGVSDDKFFHFSTLEDLPEVMILHLGRFGKKWIGFGKFSTDIYFPMDDLDFSHFESAALNPSESKYRLKAIVEHFGTMQFGHYKTYARDADNVWRCFNDEKVDVVSESDVKKAQAYILFYEKVPKPEVLNIKDLPIPFRVISDPSRWEGLVPGNGYEELSNLAHCNVTREETINDIRSRFLSQYPQSTHNVAISTEDKEKLWTFLNGDVPPPVINTCDEGVSVGNVVEMFSQPR